MEPLTYLLLQSSGLTRKSTSARLSSSESARYFSQNSRQLSLRVRKTAWISMCLMLNAYAVCACSTEQSEHGLCQLCKWFI